MLQPSLYTCISVVTRAPWVRSSLDIESYINYQAFVLARTQDADRTLVDISAVLQRGLRGGESETVLSREVFSISSPARS